MLYDLMFVYLPRLFAMLVLLLLFPYKERRRWYERRLCRHENGARSDRKHHTDRVDRYSSDQIAKCEGCAAADKWRRTLRARISMIEFEHRSFNEVLGPAVED